MDDDDDDDILDSAKRISCSDCSGLRNEFVNELSLFNNMEDEDDSAAETLLPSLLILIWREGK